VPVAAEPRREELLLAWRRGEERLYPVVMVRPELYEDYIRLVRGMADDLSKFRTEQGLIDAYDAGAAAGPEIADRLGLEHRGELDFGLARDAAYCLQHCELVGQLQREEANRRVERAREAGEEWVTVFEQATGDLHPPHRLVEMHVRSGRAIHSYVEQSPDTGGAVFGVELIRLDPVTGDWMPDVEPEARELLDDPERWRERIEELRRSGARAPEQETREEIKNGQGPAQGH
jgi:hypothetical protein